MRFGFFIAGILLTGVGVALGISVSYYFFIGAVLGIILLLMGIYGPSRTQLGAGYSASKVAARSAADYFFSILTFLLALGVLGAPYLGFSDLVSYLLLALLAFSFVVTFFAKRFLSKVFAWVEFLLVLLVVFSQDTFYLASSIGSILSGNSWIVPVIVILVSLLVIFQNKGYKS